MRARSGDPRAGHRYPRVPAAALASLCLRRYLFARPVLLRRCRRPVCRAPGRRDDPPSRSRSPKGSTAISWFTISGLSPTGPVGRSSTAACRSTVITGGVRTRQRAWTDYGIPVSCRTDPVTGGGTGACSSGCFTGRVSVGSGPEAMAGSRSPAEAFVLVFLPFFFCSSSLSRSVFVTALTISCARARSLRKS